MLPCSIWVILSPCSSAPFGVHIKSVSAAFVFDAKSRTGYVLEQIEKRLGVKAKFKYQASNAEIKETYADISKARELLGYSPTTSIESGLDQFMAWYNKLDKRTRGEWAGGRFKAERQNVHLEGTRGRV
jgi:hypothetical protein